ncbi:hypothetical protein Z052_02085 [Halorubrum sp. C191]|nr:hypothetical protein Z052_02085 [Halorubrum sp. C191]
MDLSVVEPRTDAIRAVIAPPQIEFSVFHKQRISIFTIISVDDHLKVSRRFCRYTSVESAIFSQICVRDFDKPATIKLQIPVFPDVRPIPLLVIGVVLKLDVRLVVANVDDLQVGRRGQDCRCVDFCRQVGFSHDQSCELTR